MHIPTERIGSIPRPAELIEAVEQNSSDDRTLDPLYEAAVRDTVERFEATGSPVITDGEEVPQLLDLLRARLAEHCPRRLQDPICGRHTRRMPVLTRGPFRYKRYADSYLDVAMCYANM